MSQHFPSSEPANAGALPVVRNIFDVSAEFLGQYKTWLEQNPPSIPITQIVGFSQFTASTNTIATSESTTSVTYTDLATVGPQVTGLSDGKYLIIFGAETFNSSGLSQQNYMALSLNGAAPGASTQVRHDTTGTGIVVVPVRAVVATLSGGSGGNSVKVQYTTGGGTASFQNRWLVVIRISNA